MAERAVSASARSRFFRKPKSAETTIAKAQFLIATMGHRICRSVSTCARHVRANIGRQQFAHGTAVRCISTSAWHLAASPVTAAQAVGAQLPIDYSPPTKPPSARPVETRKSQMIRTYTSLLRTTPLILFFQHSNLTAVEWAAVRRELKKALEAVPEGATNITPLVQLQVLRTNMLSVAMKIVEFYDPQAAAASKETPRISRGPLIHDLSEAAYEAVKNTQVPPESAYAQIEPLLVGPLAALVLPAVSPAHVAAALSILAPVTGQFPPPTRKKSPGYHDPICQSGLAKLLLVGGRIEGKVFDQAGVNWVGGIEGGMDGLRAQLVAMLQGAGFGITSALEGGSKALWLALEGRKTQLEDETKG